MSTSAKATTRVPIRIGSRGSPLALAQAYQTRDCLVQAAFAVEIVIIRTAGDDRVPDTAWGEGAFVTAIEAALLNKQIDVAVHSAKDVPTKEDPRLTIAAWTTREDPRDALVCRVRGMTLATLPRGARVGTDSPRRGAMLRSVRPDLRIHPLNGNVDTRLRKLDGGESDALVLAVAGLTRLGRSDRIDEVLPVEIAVPAPGQGALALQCRADDFGVIEALGALDDPASRAEVETERAFLAATGGGCRSPIGCLGTVADGILMLRVAAERTLRLPGGERRRAGVVRFEASSPISDRMALATQLAARVVRARRRARVLVTRPAVAAIPVSEALADHGFDEIVVPTIEIRDYPRAGLVEALSELGDGRVVSTSPNGVRLALAAASAAGIDPTSFGWAVVGSASALPLRALGIEPWLPARPDGATLAATLPVEQGDRLVLVRGDLADRALGHNLAERGAAVTEIVSYRTVEGPDASRGPLLAALAEPVDAIVAASGSAVRGLLALAPAKAHNRLLATPIVCIGATTARVATELGFLAVTAATDPDPETLADAVVATLLGALPAAEPEDDEPRPTDPPTAATYTAATATMTASHVITTGETQ